MPKEKKVRFASCTVFEHTPATRAAVCSQPVILATSATRGKPRTKARESFAFRVALLNAVRGRKEEEKREEEQEIEEALQEAEEASMIEDKVRSALTDIEKAKLHLATTEKVKGVVGSMLTQAQTKEEFEQVQSTQKNIAADIDKTRAAISSIESRLARSEELARRAFVARSRAKAAARKAMMYPPLSQKREGKIGELLDAAKDVHREYNEARILNSITSRVLSDARAAATVADWSAGYTLSKLGLQTRSTEASATGESGRSSGSGGSSEVGASDASKDVNGASSLYTNKDLALDSIFVPGGRTKSDMLTSISRAATGEGLALEDWLDLLLGYLPDWLKEWIQEQKQEEAKVEPTTSGRSLTDAWLEYYNAELEARRSNAPLNLTDDASNGNEETLNAGYSGLSNIYLTNFGTSALSSDVRTPELLTGEIHEGALQAAD